MIDARFHPLGGIAFWPRPVTNNRKRNPFKASYSNTLRLMERELRHLNARDIVINIDCPASSIRNDGWPRSECLVSFPGVVVAASTKHGPMQWACDACKKWEDNLRAIALTLERLRQCDLYGVTKTGEQYRGWKQLPPAAGDEGGSVTVEVAALEIVNLAGLRMVKGTALNLFTNKPEEYDRIRRLAAKNHHPDVGGDPQQWKRLDQMIRIIDAHFEAAKAGAT